MRREGQLEKGDGIASQSIEALKRSLIRDEIDESVVVLCRTLRLPSTAKVSALRMTPRAPSTVQRFNASLSAPGDRDSSQRPNDTGAVCAPDLCDRTDDIVRWFRVENLDNHGYVPHAAYWPQSSSGVSGMRSGPAEYKS